MHAGTTIKSGLAALLLGSPGLLVAQSAFDGIKAYNHLQAQCDLGTREPGSRGAAQALQYYQKVLEPLADEFQSQAFQLDDPYGAEKLNLTNVIARFHPEREERILFCAHWDTRPRAEYDPHEPLRPILGANDGASGVAVLLELAQHLPEMNLGIDIVLFDGEDYGQPGDLPNYLLGSRYYVENPVLPLPRRVILLDMVGDAELTLKIDPVSYESDPQLVEEIWSLGRELGYEQFKLSYGASMYDDHVAFIERGIPAIDIIDFEYPGPDNRYWHTHNDTPDKCSPESLTAVGSTLLQWLLRQADQ